MEKKCLVCGERKFVRKYSNGEVGRVCEGCQIEAIRVAVGRDLKNSLEVIESNSEKVIDN